MENARDFNEDFVLLEFVDESFMSRGKIYHENILDKNSKYSWTEDDPIFVYLNANHLGIHVGDPASVDQNEGREENQTQEIKFNLLKSSNDKYKTKQHQSSCQCQHPGQAIVPQGDFPQGHGQNWREGREGRHAV